MESKIYIKFNMQVWRIKKPLQKKWFLVAGTAPTLRIGVNLIYKHSKFRGWIYFI